MKRLVLVYLVLVLCYGYCSFSLAQMLEPGTTVTSEIVGEEVTDTTTVITNETTGNILGPGGTGIVAPRYESDMDQDWGGIGSASMPNCNSIFGTGTCGKGTSNTHTTFQQYVDVSQFHIKEGGALAWDLDFYHSQTNTTGYIESKGWDSNNILQWETGRVSLAYNNAATNYSGTYDFAGELSKVFISVGGAKNYYFDNYNYVLNYNTITTTTDTWFDIVEPLESITNNFIIEIEEPEIVDVAIDTSTISTGIPIFNPVSTDPGIPEIEVIEIPQPLEVIDIPEQYEEIIVEVDTFVNEVTGGGSPEQPEIEVSAPDTPEIVELDPGPENQPPEMGVESTKEEAEVVDVPTKTEDSQEESQPQEIETVEKEPETKEVAAESEAKEEPAAEKEAAAEKETAAKEESKEKTVAEKKQEKAEKIINSFDSPYQDIAGLVTLRIMDALSADLTVYQNQTLEDVTWYAQQEFYQDNYIPDPYGNYISVRSSLDMEEMIGSQYVRD